MLNQYSLLHIHDNSGIKKVKCLPPTYKIKQIPAIIKVVVLVANNPNLIKTIVPALVIRSKKPFRRFNGTWLRFSTNDAIILKPNLQPLGTKIFGPVPAEIISLYPSLKPLCSHIL